MKTIYTFLSLFIAFGLTVQSKANPEASMPQSQIVTQDIEVQVGNIIDEFNVFLYTQVLSSSNIPCKQDFFNGFNQTQIGLFVDDIFSVLTGSGLMTLIDSTLVVSPSQSTQVFTEAMKDISEEDEEQVLVVIQDFAVQVSQVEVDDMEGELEDIQSKWERCINNEPSPRLVNSF